MKHIKDFPAWYLARYRGTQPGVLGGPERVQPGDFQIVSKRGAPYTWKNVRIFAKIETGTFFYLRSTYFILIQSIPFPGKPEIDSNEEVGLVSRVYDLLKAKRGKKVDTLALYRTMTTYFSSKLLRKEKRKKYLAST